MEPVNFFACIGGWRSPPPPCRCWVAPERVTQASSPRGGRPPGSSAHTALGPGRRRSGCRVQSMRGTGLLCCDPAAVWPHGDPEKRWARVTRVGRSQRGQARVEACPVSECQPSGPARSVRSQSWEVRPCSEARALKTHSGHSPRRRLSPGWRGQAPHWAQPATAPPQRWSKWRLQRPQPRGRLPRPGPPGLLPQPLLSLGATSGCPIPAPHPLPTPSHTGPSPRAVGKCFRIDSRMTRKNLARDPKASPPATGQLTRVPARVPCPPGFRASHLGSVLPWVPCPPPGFCAPGFRGPPPGFRTHGALWPWALAGHSAGTAGLGLLPPSPGSMLPDCSWLWVALYPGSVLEEGWGAYLRGDGSHGGDTGETGDSGGAWQAEVAGRRDSGSQRHVGLYPRSFTLAAGPRRVAQPPPPRPLLEATPAGVQGKESGMDGLRTSLLWKVVGRATSTRSCLSGAEETSTCRAGVGAAGPGCAAPAALIPLSTADVSRLTQACNRSRRQMEAVNPSGAHHWDTTHAPVRLPSTGAPERRTPCRLPKAWSCLPTGDTAPKQCWACPTSRAGLGMH